jgi:hypothetical protein
MKLVQHIQTFTQFINESNKRVPIIKKFVARHAPVRDSVLMYLYEKKLASKKEFYEFLYSVKESNGIKVTKSWLSKNKKFFKKIKKNGTIYFSLNSFGNKIVEKIMSLQEGGTYDDMGPDDHMQIDLSPEEEIELRLGDMEIQISQNMKDDDNKTFAKKIEDEDGDGQDDDGDESYEDTELNIGGEDTEQEDDDEDVDYDDSSNYGLTDNR